jgi:hypothetical protein
MWWTWLDATAGAQALAPKLPVGRQYGKRCIPGRVRFRFDELAWTMIGGFAWELN